MKYQRIPEIIDAEEYKEGMEDGWTVNFSGNCFDYTEHFVSYDAAREFIDDNMGYPIINSEEDPDLGIIYEDPAAYIRVNADYYRVRKGDFIVTDGDGDRTVYQSNEFHRFFQEVKD